MTFFGTKSQFFFKVCITPQCHETKLFCTFLSKSLYAFDKKSPSKCKFSDFRLLAWKLTKYLMSSFKPRVSFPLNFASPFSVMKHNSSDIFYLKHYMLWTKEPINVQFFRLLSALTKVHPIPHTSFEATRSGFIKLLHHCSIKDNSFVFFS